MLSCWSSLDLGTVQLSGLSHSLLALTGAPLTTCSKSAVLSDNLMDFLKDIVSKAPDLGAEGDAAPPPKLKRQRCGVPNYASAYCNALFPAELRPLNPLVNVPHVLTTFPPAPPFVARTLQSARRNSCLLAPPSTCNSSPVAQSARMKHQGTTHARSAAHWPTLFRVTTGYGCQMTACDKTTP
jgi:hypothetical protein